jgi:hypothetical protein
MDPNGAVDLFWQPLFLSRYSPLDLDWSIGVDSTSNPVQSNPISVCADINNNDLNPLTILLANKDILPRDFSTPDAAPS